eukprot:1187213-Prorocentrum_minimum.AAC.2
MGTPPAPPHRLNPKALRALNLKFKIPEDPKTLDAHDEREVLGRAPLHYIRWLGHPVHQHVHHGGSREVHKNVHRAPPRPPRLARLEEQAPPLAVHHRGGGGGGTGRFLLGSICGRFGGGRDVGRRGGDGRDVGRRDVGRRGGGRRDVGRRGGGGVEGEAGVPRDSGRRGEGLPARRGEVEGHAPERGRRGQA